MESKLGVYRTVAARGIAALLRSTAIGVLRDARRELVASHAAALTVAT